MANVEHVLNPSNLPNPDAITYPRMKIQLSGGRIQEYEKCHHYDGLKRVYFWKAKEDRWH